MANTLNIWVHDEDLSFCQIDNQGEKQGGQEERIAWKLVKYLEARKKEKAKAALKRAAKEASGVGAERVKRVRKRFGPKKT